MDRITQLINELNSEDEKVRAFAAEDIAYDGIVEGFEPMLGRLQIETSRFVREAIVNSLKTMPDVINVEKLIPLLSSDDAFVRNAAIDILSGRGQSALRCLQETLHNPDKDIRKFTLDALFQINDVYSADLIAEGLDDIDINNVITAVEYLGKLEARNYCPKINQIFMTTENTLLRCTCLEVLAVIGNKESSELVSEKYPNYQLISFLEKYSFLKFVAHQGNETHLPLIMALMKDKGQVMHKEIINAIEGI
jgi:HEAT repeat protein